MHASPTPRFDDVRLEDLRARRSAKWTRYASDVLPAWVAEMDFPLAPPVHAVLVEAIERDDTGYANVGELPAAFASFASAQWGWGVDPKRTLLVADVMSGIAEVIRALTAPGDRIAISPPVYPPFFSVVRDAGRELVEAPLTADYRLDVDALEQAFAGARMYLLCSPHNPTGTVFTRDELEQLRQLADAHGVLVVSDEVHAPMTLPGATHVPYPTVGDGLALVSASKAWNLAGLKSALIVAGSDETAAALRRIPEHVSYHAGHLGVIGNTTAFADGGAWLDALVGHLDRQRTRLAELLATELPQVRWIPPAAGYLAWLDCRGLGLGDDPSAAFLERGRVALSPGPTFGVRGNGYARLNIGTSGDLLAEAVTRMASAAR